MLNMDTPAGSNASGPSPAPTREDQSGGDSFVLPEKLRVHALAKMLEASSREVITTLESLGEVVRSAQSNITRDVALEVVRILRPDRVEESAGGNESDRQGADRPAASSEEARQESSADTTSAEPTTGLTPVFAPPQAMFLAPEPRSVPEAEPAREEPQPAQRREETSSTTESATETGGNEEGGSSRRRRRRGRRGRGRGRGGDEQTAEAAETTEQQATEEKKADKAEKQAKKDKTAEAEQSSESESSESGTSEGTRRRRRRRRRKGSQEEESQARDDDPPNTVVHVRETQPDSSDDEVRAVKGSTRLEAKRQRRRDGREAGRRRAPVLSESEFLARRESVERRMVVRENGDQTQIAVLEDNVLVENFVTSSGSGSLVGNVYLGRVQNVLPSMEAAFVDIGKGRNAVLYAGEVDWDAAGLAGKARRIEQALSTGDSVLVQVTKDPVGHKGARLTTQISLPGRFLVYVPGGGATGISRKLPDTERKRLKEILKRIVPDNAGVIIRTASEGTSEEALDRDVRRLQAQWDVIKEKAEAPKAQAPQLLYEEPDLLIKVVRDLFTEDFTSLTVQGNQAWDTIEAYVQHVAPDLMSRLYKHTGKNDVFTEQRITEQISKALDRKVWLPSGGYLVIDRTEAMTVIDVNTGKFTGSGGNLEETVTRNNLEAAEEIVRQLRLRDIGGIIVIDFIDMVLESNRDLVLRRLTECLGRDRTRHQVAEVTSLGLVQMTRKRVGTGLLEAYSSTCEHCRGRGLVVSTEPVTHSHAQSNGGSRRGRNRGKQAAPAPEAAPAEAPAEVPAAESPATTPAAEAPAEAEQAVAASATEQAPVAATEERQAPVTAGLEATEHPVSSAEAAAPSAGESNESSQADSETTQGEPEKHTAAAAERPRRRKVRRPAGSAGTAPGPMVIASKPTSSAEQEQGERTTGVSAATPVSRRRRAASRPAGPASEERDS